MSFFSPDLPYLPEPNPFPSLPTHTHGYLWDLHCFPILLPPVSQTRGSLWCSGSVEVPFKTPAFNPIQSPIYQVPEYVSFLTLFLTWIQVFLVISMPFHSIHSFLFIQHFTCPDIIQPFQLSFFFIHLVFLCRDACLSQWPIVVSPHHDFSSLSCLYTPSLRFRVVSFCVYFQLVVPFRIDPIGCYPSLSPPWDSVAWSSLPSEWIKTCLVLRVQLLGPTHLLLISTGYLLLAITRPIPIPFSFSYIKI